MWGVLALEVPEEQQDELIALLAAGSLGAEVAACRPGVALVRVYLDSPAAAESLAQGAAALLRARRLDPGVCVLSAGRIDDGRWVEGYQAALRPFPLGRRFTVYPARGPSRRGRRQPILLVPGRAFGTGEHQTTRLCAAELERRVRPGGCWLDLGCGSGILSLVAHHCGATVRALDEDPEAIAVAGAVMEANGLSGRIELVCGTDASGHSRTWDGVVANIGASFLCETAGRLHALLNPGGLLIASGFAPAELPEVRRALGAAGLEPIARHSRQGWTVTVERRRPRGG